MRLLAIVLISALAPTSAAAQTHLEPEESLFTSALSEYYIAVGKVLLSDVPFTALKVVTIPSFEVEWSAWVVEGPQPQACSRVATAHIFNGDKPAEPNLPASPPKSNCVPLGSAIAKDIAEAWAAMLRGVRYPPPSNTITVDGTFYHFSGFDQAHLLAGRTHSPQANTAAGRLVSAAEALRAYAIIPSPEREQSLCRLIAAIRPDGRRLTTRCSLRGNAALAPPSATPTGQDKRVEPRPFKPDKVRELGHGFRLVFGTQEMPPDFWEALAHFVFLYYQGLELSQTDNVSVAPSGKQAMFQDGATGDVVLFVAASRQKRVVTPFRGSLVRQYTWNASESKVILTFWDNTTAIVKLEL